MLCDSNKICWQLLQPLLSRNSTPLLWVSVVAEWLTCAKIWLCHNALNKGEEASQEDAKIYKPCIWHAQTTLQDTLYVFFFRMHHPCEPLFAVIVLIVTVAVVATATVIVATVVQLMLRWLRHLPCKRYPSDNRLKSNCHPIMVSVAVR